MMPPRQRLAASERGFTLIELSVVLALAGGAAVMLWQLSQLGRTQQATQQEQALLKRADQALRGFILQHQRLPCPATSPTEGLEQCGARQHAGWLPFRTLGLPDARMGGVRYGVLQVTGHDDTAGTIHDIRLTERQRRAQYLLLNLSIPATPALGTVTPASIPDANQATREGAYMLDFCAALDSAAHLALNARALHLRQPSSPYAPARNVAYALAIPDAGSGTAVTDPGFDAPGRPRDGAGSYDRVLAATPQSLWASLSCEALMSAMRAQSNTLLAASMHQRSLTDLYNQLDIKLDSAMANRMARIASTTKASVDVVRTTASFLAAVSDAISTYGAMTYKVVVTGAAVAFAGTKLHNSVGKLAPAERARENARDNRDHVRDTLLPKATMTQAALNSRLTNLFNGLYLASPIVALPEDDEEENAP